MSNDRKDREWLRSQVTSLFEDATADPESDIAAKIKLAELLYKLLPAGTATQKGDPLTRLREEVNDGRDAHNED